MLLCSAICFLSCATPERKDESLSVDECFTFAGAQLRRSVERVEDGTHFPRYTGNNGAWETTDSKAWSSGFFAGCLWLMYEHTRDEIWKKYAMTWTLGLEIEKFNKDNHNNGFRMMSSFGNGYRLTADEHYKEVLIESARSLASRYSEKVGLIKFSEMEPWKYPVLVDTMVNLELLFWASKNGGDKEWYSIAETHALNTIRDHIREDGSTVQLVDYDPETGEVIAHDTLCGLSSKSAWSRGQGEALYGFTMAYRETQNPKMLEAAKKIADYFIENLPYDYVPYWDFRAPNRPREIRDSSAASIAASALLELCTVVNEPGDMDKYFTAAGNIIISLCSPEYLAQGGDGYGLLSHATWKKPTDPQADTSLIWGDYYFLEALHRYVKVVLYFKSLGGRSTVL